MPERNESTWDVLVVDDEPVVRDGIRKVLEADGFRVATAPDAETALAHPALAECRVVLCDLVMPDGSGIGLIRTIRERRPRLPIVLCTGYATPEQRDLAMGAGASVFLAKPFDDSELLKVVRGALGPLEVPAKERRQ